MHRFTSIVVFSLLIFTTISLSQPPGDHPGGRARGGERPAIGEVIGRVLDASSENPIPYANIVLYSGRDSSNVTGTATDSRGYFDMSEIKLGRYFVTISFMGYETETIRGIGLGPRGLKSDLGDILLSPTALMLEGAEVQIDKPLVMFKIDKKVINVSRDIASKSGTAVDALENAPSVEVDIDGNVALRGSSSFTVMIDGRPSILDPNDALQTIPASTIEDIEIITNPSAKFDPDGVAGIINVVLKKQKLRGISGIVNGNLGMYDTYGGDFLINLKKKNYSLNFGVDLNQRFRPGTNESRNRTTSDGVDYHVNSEGESDHGGKHNSIRAGIEYEITPRDRLTLGLSVGQRSRKYSSDLDFTQWQEPGGPVSEHSSESQTERSGDSYSMNLDYLRDFKEEGHRLTGHFSFDNRGGDEESTAKLFDTDGNLISGKISTEDGPGIRMRIKADYSLPLNKDAKFEAGLQSRLGTSEDITNQLEYDPATGLYEELTEFNHKTDYIRDIHSLYTQYANEIGKLGFQGGLRGEYAYRKIETGVTNATFSIDRVDMFPTAHFSYHLTDRNQLMVSYARRIDRPRGWYLEPFETWTDDYNVRVGNPDLKPEYIDSYELGFQTFRNRNSLSTELYYRKTNNKIERVRSVYSENVTLHSTENVGTDYAMGAELMLKVDPAQWWNLSLTYNVYDYKVEGELNGVDFSNESSNWGLRMNNDFRIGELTRIQLSGSYRGPTASAQGSESERYSSNLAIKREIIPKKLSATLQIRDIVGSSGHEHISEGVDFYNYRFREHKSPSVSLSVSYNFNNYESERRRSGGSGDDMGDEDF